MSRKSSGPLPGLAVGIVVVAALATLVAQDGWVLWFPALAALAMAAAVRDKLLH
jgi:hypothetical protein